MKSIAVIGSVNIDNTTYIDRMPGPGETIIGQNFLSNIGGKGANQACAAFLLGANIKFFCSVGNDDNGLKIRRFFEAINLNVSIKNSESITGTATIIVNTQSAENRIVVIPGANSDINDKDVDTWEDDLKHSDILIMQLENPVETVYYALKKAKENGLITILNPAPYHKLDEENFKFIDFFIPNEHEIEQFVPNSIAKSYEQKAKFLLSKGIKNIIVTLGEKGSILANDDGIDYINAFKVNAVDTTAAGDCFCGAFATGLAEGKSISESIHFASKASAIAVTRKGAISSLPRMDEVIGLVD